MKRAISVLIAVVIATICVPASPAVAASFIESFETGFGGWQPDSDGRAPAWSVTRSTEQAFDGKYSVRIFMDGRLDDGTTWVEQRFTVTPGATVTVGLVFYLWSERQAIAGNWNVVAMAGTRDPEGELDFDIIGITEAAAGWKQYGKSWTVKADTTGGVWVAFGTSVTWEVNKHHYVDYVRVTIQ